jgi:hypothetical protein
MIHRNILLKLSWLIFTLNWHVSLGHFLYSRSAAYKFVDKKNLSADLHGSALKKSDCTLQLFQCYIVIQTASSAASQIPLLTETHSTL